MNDMVPVNRHFGFRVLRTRQVLGIVMLATSVFLSPAVRAETGKLAKSDQAIQEWKILGESGLVRFVYVSPAGLKDKYFVAQVLQAISTKSSQNRPIEILLFDSRSFTPRAYPMTDSQMLHWKARYNRNPNRNIEKFVWVSVLNSKTSPPKLKETQASIKPGFAE